MSKRRRIKLVPDESLEIFETRQALYYQKDGTIMVAYIVERPDGSSAKNIPMYEILGTMAYAAISMMYDHLKEQDEDK